MNDNYAQDTPTASIRIDESDKPVVVKTVYVSQDSIDEIAEAVAKKVSQPEQRWIPCSERLPNKSGEYLITGVEISPGVYQSFYYKSENAWSHWNLIVTAWMPLPEPYREEGEQNG